MIYIIDKKTNEVKMVSKSKIDFDEEKFYSKSIKDDDYEGYRLIYDGKKLIKEPRDKKENIMAEVDSATTVDELKEIIKKLL